MTYTIRKATSDENRGRVVPVAYIIEPDAPRHDFDSWELIPANDDGILRARYSADFKSRRKPGATFWQVTETNGELHAVGMDGYGRHIATITSAA